MVGDEATCVELQLGRTREEIKGGALWENGGREISDQI
jgi:hypothetical protein